MNAQGYCPSCGAVRPPGAAFCASCGRRFETDSPTISPQAVAGSPATLSTPAAASSASPALMAGVAWIVAAALTGYLAYQQWSIGSFLGSSDLQTTAAWNAFACVVTLYFAAKLITAPSRKLLDRSAAWAVLSVLLGLVQITVAGDIFALAIIATGVAGVLSWVGRQGWPDPPHAPAPAAWAGPSSGPLSEPASPLGGIQSEPRASRFSGPELAVIALIVLAVAGGGYVVLNGGLGAAGATTGPTARVTPSPVVADGDDDDRIADIVIRTTDRILELSGSDFASMTDAQTVRIFEQLRDASSSAEVQLRALSPSSCMRPAWTQAIEGLGRMAAASVAFIDWVVAGAIGEFDSNEFLEAGSQVGTASGMVSAC